MEENSLIRLSESLDLKCPQKKNRTLHQMFILHLFIVLSSVLCRTHSF